MKYKKTNISNIFLYDTKIENLFINEYMLAAPGEYVKVYLLGCMFAESNMPINNELLAKQLGATENEVEKAWKFWENNGVVKIKDRGQTIEIINLKEIMFGTIEATYDDDKELNNKAMEEVFKAIENKWGIMLDANELEQLIGWPSLYNIEPEYILYGINYCGEKDKKNIRYLEKVIIGWLENDCHSVEDIKNYLGEVDQKYQRQKRILKALGFTRNATEAEAKLINSWFDDLHFNMEKVLLACEKTSGITNPNIKYVNTVLENWAKEAKSIGTDVNKKSVVTRAVINEYLQWLRDKEEQEADERKKEVYKKVPKIKKIDTNMAELNVVLSKAIVAGNTEEISNIKKQIDDLLAERAITLTDNNFRIDYTDVKYSCEICKDTGITDDGDRCECMNKKAEEAEVWVNLEK